jgi:nicotinate phosphoribosyltransferase
MAKEIVRPEAATAPAVPNDGEESDSQATTAWPRRNGDINAWTDHYFNRTQDVVGRFGDRKVTYALFLRRPCVSAPRLAIAWLEGVAAERGIGFDIDLRYEESRWVGAGEPLIYVTGSLYHLVDLETLLLQKLGPACVAAYNAYTMCADLPKVAFLAMDARHCAGTEMAEMMAYAASVGSARAGNEGGMGTMPHALVGYAGSTVRAAEMFDESFPDVPMTVLVDYFGQEVSDSLAVCRRFPERCAAGTLSMRIDTPGGRFLEGLDPAASYAVLERPGGRFLEGLDPAASYAVLERHVPEAVRGYRNEVELRYLVGAGVSAAAIWHLREMLDEAGFHKVKIVASSGFNPAKCRLMAEAKAPIDMIGTGSFLPELWSETYATADIVEYDGEPRVKVGREFLLRK